MALLVTLDVSRTAVDLRRRRQAARQPEDTSSSPTTGEYVDTVQEVVDSPDTQDVSESETILKPPPAPASDYPEEEADRG